MGYGVFIEAAIFSWSDPSHDESGWTDKSTSDRLQFTAPCGYVSIARRYTYPATFAFIKNDTLWCGYGPSELVEEVLKTPLQGIPERVFCDDEFLFLAIDCRKRSALVQTDAYNTVSVFVGSQADRCIISSDFARTFELLDSKRCRVDMRCVAQYLLSALTYDGTFLQDIRLLYDRKRYRWSVSGGQLWLPADARMKDYHNNRTGDVRLFPTMLEQTVDAYWTRYTKGGVGSCELSYGLDSSVVAGYLADQGYSPTTITALFPKDFGRTQRQKMDHFGKRFDIEELALPAAEYLDYHWMEVLQGQASRPFYHYQAQPYRTVHDDFYRALADKGVTSLFSGIGGDELFEHVDHRHVMSNTSRGSQRFIALPIFRELASYVTEIAKEQHTPQLPVPLRSHSTLLSSFASGNDYLDYGLWYVSPLADPRLYAYMQTVPLHYCVDKLLLRIYADLRLFPKTISLPDVNEDFRHVQVDTFHRLKAVILYMLDNSILIDSGLMQRRPLLDLYQSLANDDESEDFTTALIFQRILFTELNLRSLGVTSL